MIYYHAARGGNGIALPIIYLGARRGWVVNTTTQPPYPRKREPLPAVHLGGTQGWCRQVKKILPPLGFRHQQNKC